MKHSEIYRVTAQLLGHVAGNCWAKANETHGLSFWAVISSFLFLTLQTGIRLPQQLQSQTETQLVSSFKYLFLFCPVNTK